VSGRDGGPAFPWGDINLGGNAGGMSLRDYFAAKAMQAYIAHLSCGGTESVSNHYGEVARESYGIADVMLVVREENKS
jgi:hypothetical protein